MCINIFEMIKKLLKIDYQMAFKKKKIIKREVIAVCESVSKLTKYKFRGVACIIWNVFKSREGKDKWGKSAACCNKIKISTSQQNNIVLCAPFVPSRSNSDFRALQQQAGPYIRLHVRLKYVFDWKGDSFFVSCSSSTSSKINAFERNKTKLGILLCVWCFIRSLNSTALFFFLFEKARICFYFLVAKLWWPSLVWTFWEYARNGFISFWVILSVLIQ